jgi:anti-anti-sigma regulatory factor
LAVELEPALAGLLADAVLARVMACGSEVGTVVLDLGAGTGIDAYGCAALGALAGQLAADGTGLRLAASSAQAWQLFQQTGLTGRLGATAIHRSPRAAVLASYAALPGPGLVTPEVAAALVAVADQVRLTPG